MISTGVIELAAVAFLLLHVAAGLYMLSVRRRLREQGEGIRTILSFLEVDAWRPKDTPRMNVRRVLRQIARRKHRARS